MKPTLNEKFLAYLALFSGLFLSLVAEYYSLLGLTAIFAAAVIPVIIMGVALGLGKVAATLWLKQNWKIAPITVRVYLAVAIAILMLVTSMGIFGLLSKAHSDQTLVGGDVLAKINVYDEKIKTERESIDVNRKALQQMDQGIDQIMGRSTTEGSAEKAVAIRKGQQKERQRILSEISTSQQTINNLNNERAPIAAEVRKVEAEVGPIKYIAAFVYGNTDPTILEKAVTWVIITIIVVFDPMALILLLASQISFQDFREREQESAEGDSPEKESDVVSTATVTPTISEDEFVKEDYVKWPGGQEPLFCNKCGTELFNAPGIGFYCPNKECKVLDEPFANDTVDTLSTGSTVDIYEPFDFDKHPYLFTTSNGFKSTTPIVYKPVVPESYVQNEEQADSNLWTLTTVLDEGTEEHRRDVEINRWARLIKAKQASMKDVPEHMVMDVRSRV